MKGVILDEKDLSATQHEEAKNTRIQVEDQDQGRSKHPAPEKAKGEEETHCFLLKMGRMVRLTRREDFTRLFREGEKYDFGPVRLWAASKKEGPLRTAFVGKSKRSVRRNRIRRRLREAFLRHFFPYVNHLPCDLLFMSDERLMRSDFLAIAEWIGELLLRAGILEKDRIYSECKKKYPEKR